MKLVAIAFAAVLAASPVGAGCIPLTIVTGESIIVNQGGNLAEFFYDDLRRGSDDLRGKQLEEALQAQVDGRAERLSIVSDDPDRSVNPDKPTSYWSDADGNPVDSIFDATHLTNRCVLVTVLFWNGTDFLVHWQSVN